MNQELMGCAISFVMIYLIFFDAQVVLFTFVVLSPFFIKVKTRNEAVLMCDFDRSENGFSRFKSW